MGYGDVRLIITKEDSAGPYVTLSHRWGPANVAVLTSGNIDELCTGIASQGLNKTFRDAITVTRRMAIRYLWIDSLCIMQGTEVLSRADWRRESLRMESYFSNALCNISATASESADRGLFRTSSSDTLRHYIHTFVPETGRKVYCLVVDIRAWQNQLNNAPLHKRGWVLQERLLARRILHFGAKQLIWDCTEHQAAETYPSGLPPILAAFIKVKDVMQHFRSPAKDLQRHTSSHHLYEQWDNVKYNYSRCSPTFASDKPVAIMGIAMRFQRALPDDEYVHGMWRADLLRQLLWRRSDSEYLHASLQTDELARNKVPSWSWLSCDYSLTRDREMYSDISQANHLYAEIIKAERTLEGEQIKSLQIKCRLRQMEFQVPRLGDIDASLRGRPSGHIPGDLSFLYLDTSVRELANIGDVLATSYVPIRRYNDDDVLGWIDTLDGLILEAIPGQRGTYQRLGLLKVQSAESIELLLADQEDAAAHSCLSYDELTKLHIIRLI